MTANSSSILDSIKKTLGIDSDYDAFDLDVIMHINTAFSTLHQLGVGPRSGFAIEDNSALWSSYSDNMVLLASVKSYVYAKVKLLFDPPSTSFGLDAMQKMVSELEWRLNVAAETISPPSSANVNPFLWDLTGQSDFPSEANPGDLGIDKVSGDIWENQS
jgi:hypothetical protein